jgi:hypothetical protein
VDYCLLTVSYIVAQFVSKVEIVSEYPPTSEDKSSTESFKGVIVLFKSVKSCSNESISPPKVSYNLDISELTDCFRVLIPAELLSILLCKALVASSNKVLKVYSSGIPKFLRACAFSISVLNSLK